MCNRKKIGVLLCLISSFTSAEITINSDYERCINTASGQSLNICMDKELKFQDTKLNKEYHNTMERIQEFRKEDLKKIQRLWIKYRDAKCDFYYHKYSGSGDLTDSIQCAIKETLQRTEELKNTY